MSAFAGRDIILTGIPRSGTTLLGAIFDSMDNTVSLNEPRWQFDWLAANHKRRSAEEAAEYIMSDFKRIRAALLAGEPIEDRRKPDGSPITENHRDAEGNVVKESYAPMAFHKKGLPPDFTLAIKHLGPYMSLLPVLAERFPVVAILRHPQDVIASWNNVKIPLSSGKMPGAEFYAPNIRNIGASMRSVRKKQVLIYNALCRRLHEHRKRITVLRYEDLPGALDSLSLLGGRIPPDISIKPKERMADNAELGKILSRHAPYAALFYPDIL